jgi:dihydroceramide fatty acyl 2-hydroxylase
VKLREVDDIGMLAAPTALHGAITVAAISLGAVHRGPLAAALAVLLGVALWTLGEYLVHRFIEHGRFKKGRLDYVDNHALHHLTPSVARHFVYPLKLTLPMAALAFGAWLLLFREPWLALAMTGGTTLSYLLNEWVHFSAHRPALLEGRPWLSRVTRAHLRHHNEDPTRHFGFFTTFWDHVFRTS